MSRWLTGLVGLVRPGLPEPIDEAEWRRAERLALWIPPGLALANSLPLIFSGLLFPGMSADLYRVFIWLNLPAHALIVLINALTLRYARAERDHRRSAYLSAALLNWTSATGLLVGTHVLIGVLMAITIAFFRVATDGRLGFWTMATAVVMTIAIGAVQIAGWAPLPRLVGLPGASGHPAALMSLTVWFVAILLLAWALSSHVANRFRAGAHALAVQRTEARRDLTRALIEAGQGRLSGGEIAGYRLAELLGRGGMGEVYAATAADGSDAAIKVLHPHLLEREEMLARFQREAKAARRMSSTHVPEVLAVGTTDEGGAYIAMERLRGEDLAAMLRRRGALPVDEVVALVRAIAEALDAAHAAGVVHRDLKPQNVFLLSEHSPEAPAIRLLDFGIARLVDSVGDATLTHASSLLGSPGFMAPEQARGDTQLIGPATDVFALGAIAYRALTGTDAFPARNTAAAVFESIRRHPPPPTELRLDLPPQLDTVISIALAKSSQHRYATAAELAEDLALAARGELPDNAYQRAAELPDGAGDTVTL